MSSQVSDMSFGFPRTKISPLVTRRNRDASSDVTRHGYVIRNRGGKLRELANNCNSSSDVTSDTSKRYDVTTYRPRPERYDVTAGDAVKIYDVSDDVVCKDHSHNSQDIQLPPVSGASVTALSCKEGSNGLTMTSLSDGYRMEPQTNETKVTSLAGEHSTQSHFEGFSKVPEDLIGGKDMEHKIALTRSSQLVDTGIVIFV